MFEAGVVFAGILANQTLKTRIKKKGLEEKQFFGNIKVGHKQATDFLNRAKRLNDHTLVKQGQYGNRHRTTKYPFDENLQNHKTVKWQSRTKIILDRKTLISVDKDPKDKKGMTFQEFSAYNKAKAEQGDVLCRGEQLRVILKLIFAKRISGTFCN